VTVSVSVPTQAAVASIPPLFSDTVRQHFQSQLGMSRSAYARGLADGTVVPAGSFKRIALESSLRGILNTLRGGAATGPMRRTLLACAFGDRELCDEECGLRIVANGILHYSKFDFAARAQDGEHITSIQACVSPRRINKKKSITSAYCASCEKHTAQLLDAILGAPDVRPRLSCAPYFAFALCEFGFVRAKDARAHVVQLREAFLGDFPSE
jgi:hypothetical protein